MMGQSVECETTIGVRVVGTYTPYRAATFDAPPEGGYCVDVRVLIDHPNLGDEQADITENLPTSLLMTLSDVLAEASRQ